MTADVTYRGPKVPGLHVTQTKDLAGFVFQPPEYHRHRKAGCAALGRPISATRPSRLLPRTKKGRQRQGWTSRVAARLLHGACPSRPDGAVTAARSHAAAVSFYTLISVIVIDEAMTPPNNRDPAEPLNVSVPDVGPARTLNVVADVVPAVM